MTAFQRLRVDDGDYEILLPNRDTDYIQRKIATDQEPYELSMLRDIARRVSEGDLVLDVGANIGNHTLYLASVAGARVSAFEPNSALCAALEKSVERNGLASRIEVQCVGVGSEPAKAHFTEVREDNLGAQALEVGEGDNDVITVIRLDDLDFGKRVAVMKIDVEGMELDVLKGAEALIQKDQPLIYVECKTEESFREIHSVLAAHGYVYWDTFNATPTHLFLHSSCVSDAGRMERLIAKVVRDEYQLDGQIKELRASLDQANRKYRSANEKIVSLREKLDSSKRNHEEVVGKLDAHIEELKSVRASLEGRLEQANSERGLLAERLAKIGAEYDDLLRRNERLHAEREASLKEHERLQAEWSADYRRALDEKQSLQTAYKASLRERDRLLSEANVAKMRLDETSLKLDEVLRWAGQLEEDRQAALSRYERERQSLHDQLNAANSKYRRVTSQLDAIRQSKAYRAAVYFSEAKRSWRGVAKLPQRLLQLAFRQPESKGDVRPTNQGDSATGRIPSSTSTVGVLPGSVGFSSLGQMRVACIMDDFTFSSFFPECRLYQLTPADWQTELEDSSPDVLIVESAWRGKDELWDGKVAHRGKELEGIVAWCRQRRIPTVFWNKEDPIHCQTFLNTAQLFDYVFTVDIDCIHRYKAALKHDRVYLLPFACQPSLHNPIEKYQRKDAFCFAGAYYQRYPERARDLANFVETLPEYRPLEIYDRNYRKSDSRYQFPECYQSYIVGNLPFEQIDKAYKGYVYAINLNSMKQSQSMFARRVFELLGCNTVTVSNYSRGLRLLFGDLVFASDEGTELIARLQSMSSGDASLDKLRLAALRKVMQEHTYEDRLAYVVSKLKSEPVPNLLPDVVAVGYAETAGQRDSLLGHFQRQNYESRRLLLVAADDAVADGWCSRDERVEVISERAAADRGIEEFAGGALWMAGLVPEDYYGPNYLTDLALATRYCTAPVIGKAAHHRWSPDSGIEVLDLDQAYRGVATVAARAAMQSISRCAGRPALSVAKEVCDQAIEGVEIQAIDAFNYCRDGEAEEAPRSLIVAAVDDLSELDTGLSLQQLVGRAEGIEAQADTADAVPVISGDQLASYFRPSRRKPYQFSVVDRQWVVKSILPDGKHDYLYASRDVKPADLGYSGKAAFYLDATPGLNIQLAIIFLDHDKQRIGAEVRVANRNQEVAIPEGTEYIRLGLRIYGSGSASINGLVLGHRRLEPADIIGRNQYLLLTNHYPDYEDLYRNAFVHSRVKAYQQRGVGVDVFRLRPGTPVSYHEFQDVDVITGARSALRKVLSTGEYRHVLVHFLDAQMWEALGDFVDELPITVWVHGAEIHPWYRRKFNIVTAEDEARARAQSDVRMAFWRELLTTMPRNLRLVFVSNTFAEEVMEDLGFLLPQQQYAIIHNPIDTALFSYREKPASQRKKVLSIRPFASHQYANDLAVQAICLLRDRPVFDEMEFRFIGDGYLFDETVAPLRGLPNVTLERRFLTRTQIAELHREYGVFLCPTRWDSQGVSRDEAMASGLVPVTCRIAAVPEFVSDSCGIMVEPEDAEALAIKLEELVRDPELFSGLSRAASEQVRADRDMARCIQAEIKYFSEVESDS